MQLSTVQLLHIRGALNYHRNSCALTISISFQKKKQNKPKTNPLKYPFISPEPYPVADRLMVPLQTRLSFLGYSFQGTNKERSG